MKVIVIGAGASGLVTLKYLTTAHQFFPIEPLDVQLYEGEENIGGTFKYRVWEGAELVSSKYLTAFSDFRFPENEPDFVGPARYVQYLEDYAKHFDLLDHIRFKTLVTNVRRHEGDGHIVTTQDRDTREIQEHHCDAVIVCSGLNLTPSIPTNIEGLLPEGLTASNPSTAWTVPLDLPPTTSPSSSFMNALSTKLSPLSPSESHTFRAIHSSNFKNLPGADSEFLPAHPKQTRNTSAKANPSKGSTILILGAGETAHDIAYTAINSPLVSRVVLAHQSGFFVAPKITPSPIILRFWGKPYEGQKPNKPLDCTVASLFDTAYVPGWLQRGGLLWGYYEAWVRGMFWVCTGAGSGWGQELGGRRGGVDSVFMVKSDRAVHYLSQENQKRWVNKIRGFFIDIYRPDTKGKEIELAPWPTRVKRVRKKYVVPDCDDEEEVDVIEFEDNGSPESERLKTKPPVILDTVIFATGYKRDFPFLEENYPRPAECTVRGIYRDITESFAYIGMVRPAIGAIPPLSELQIALYTLRLLSHHFSLPTPIKSSPRSLPPYELSYTLTQHPADPSSRNVVTTKLGVDHESYAYQLALDMGAAPRASYLLRKHGWKVFFTWAMGPNFNTKFRLVGPWSGKEVEVKMAEEVLAGELWGVVRRSGGGVFFVTYTLIPQILFGLMSLASMVWDWIKGTAWMCFE